MDLGKRADGDLSVDGETDFCSKTFKYPGSVIAWNLGDDPEEGSYLRLIEFCITQLLARE